MTPSFSGGGAERIAVNLANFYAQQGFDVSLLVFKGVGPYANQVCKKVRLLDLKVSRARYAFFKLLKVLEDEKPTQVLSVIRSSNILIGLASFFKKNYRLVFREANTMNAVVNLPVVYQFFYRGLMRVSYRKADGIIANSEDTKCDLLNNKITGSGKIVVIGNPVLPADYSSKSNVLLIHPWFARKDIRVILNAGRLHEQKNQQLLIRSFAKASEFLDDLRLVILGEGEEKGRLEYLAKQLGVADKLEILPFQDNPYPYYKNADLFVLTSNWEGFGNVLVESMACGTPVISTNCPGGPKSILQGGRFGELVPVDDEPALTAALIKHFESRCETNVDAIISNAEKYTVNMLARCYLDFLTQE